MICFLAVRHQQYTFFYIKVIYGGDDKQCIRAFSDPVQQQHIPLLGIGGFLVHLLGRIKGMIK